MSTWEQAREARGALMVDVVPLREAFVASGLTGGEVAQRLGWTKPHWRYPTTARPVGDQSRVKRVLGLRQYNPGQGYPSRYRERMTYDMAVRMAEALNVDPFEVGL
jgi:hypothetical protein